MGNEVYMAVGIIIKNAVSSALFILVIILLLFVKKKSNNILIYITVWLFVENKGYTRYSFT